MSIERIIGSPFSWAAAGFFIGLGLGVNAASVWLLAAGLGAFVFHLWYRGPAQPDTEGMLFAAGPAFITSWILGFIVHGIAF